MRCQADLWKGEFVRGAEKSVDIVNARVLDDLGEPPSERRARSAWVRERFVEVGCVWYGPARSDPRWQRELEDLALSLLREHHDVLPSLSTLKRIVANVSFLPSTVEALWSRAFPPSAGDRAHNTSEWAVLEGTRSKVVDLWRTGKVQEAEALRSSAVAFFNRYLGSDEVGEVLRRKARHDLRKGD